MKLFQEGFDRKTVRKTVLLFQRTHVCMNCHLFFKLTVAYVQIEQQYFIYAVKSGNGTTGLFLC